MKKVFGLTRNWIAAVKYLCSRRGLIQPYTSREIPDVSEEEKKHIEEYLEKYDGILSGYFEMGKKNTSV